MKNRQNLNAITAILTIVFCIGAGIAYIRFFDEYVRDYWYAFIGAAVAILGGLIAAIWRWFKHGNK